MEWINVKDKVPKSGEYVLAINKKHLPCIAMWHDQQKCFSVDGRSVTGFTHWQSLPKPLEEQS